ncbi:hypothetical protein NG42_14015 [Winslowiella iniecta]|uniref:Uncharacterized protein n=1 Tax=Winslowiella iniecta TaxID=1560201 RepID=A0A0L7T0S9_9GAMM|nr:hypothetical protein NG42_14015 [Winslowiella iniecta]KOC92639.1 hypothetical protein NG43_12840 [Winslowiella iniecta]
MLSTHVHVKIINNKTLKTETDLIDSIIFVFLQKSFFQRFNHNMLIFKRLKFSSISRFAARIDR